MSDNMSSLTPGQKLLSLVEILAEDGPLTLDMISERAGFSRSATHRLLASLVEIRWARLRRSDRHYQLTSKLKALSESAFHYLDETETIAEIVETAIDKNQFKYTIAIVINKAAHVVETTEPRQDCDVKLPYLNDDLAMATLLTVDLPKLAGLVKEEIETAQKRNIALPNLNEFHKKLIEARQAGRIEPRLRQIILPFSLHGSVYGAVRIKATHAVTAQTFEKVIGDIQGKLKALN